MYCVNNAESIFFSLCDSIVTATHGVNLRLLKVIEQTVGSLISEQNTIESLTKLIRSHMIGTECVLPEIIDPHNKIIDKIEQTEDLLLERLDVLKAKRASALYDPELNGDHEESVVMEFERTEDRLVELIETMSDLRNQIKEHDASLDEKLESFDNATDLVNFLRN